jgi:hypothetical protein
MLASFKDWWAKPFSADMPALEWVAFVGLLIIAAILWNFVLSHLREAL